MRNEYREVDCAYPPLPRKPHASNLRMINQIGCQKTCGARKRGNHAGAVFPDFPLPYEIEACKEAESAESVQDGIEKGEVVDIHGDAQRITRSRTIASINAGRYMREAKKSLRAATLVRLNSRRNAHRRNPAPSTTADTP